MITLKINGATYELDVDPGETRVVTSETQVRPLTTELLGWLRQQWRAYRVLPNAGRQVALDSANIERLKALGYLD